MSVINDMLNDLEQRKAQPNERAQDLQRSLVVRSQPGKKKWLIPAGLSLLGLVVLLMWFWPDYETAKPLELVQDSGTDVSFHSPETSKVNSEPRFIETPGREGEQALLSAAATSEDLQKKPEAKHVAAEPTPSVQKASIAEVSKPEEKKSAVVRSEPDRAKQMQVSEPNEPASQPVQSAQVREVKPEQSVQMTPTVSDRQFAESMKKLISEGGSNQALRQLYQFIERNDDHSYSRLVLATELLQQGRLAELKDALLAVDSSSMPELKQLKARWYAQTERTALAIRFLENQAPELADYPEYFSLLASFYQRNGMHVDSVDLYSRLLEVQAEVPQWWIGMAIGLDQLQRYTDAALAYRQALALPNMPDTLVEFASKRLERLQISTQSQ